jgi:queuine/archaeosine tRNA-ribosyltransferase
MIVEYYPSASVFAEITRRIQIEGQHIRFWEGLENTWKYDKVLFSYAYQGKVNPRKYFNIRDDVSIMGDSGGFQMATKGHCQEPTDVLHWLENYCDMGFSLDIPATKEITYEKAISMTETMVEVFADNRTPGNKCNILNVMHGDTPEQFDNWIKTMKPYQHAFQGYAVTNSVLASEAGGYTTTLYQVGRLLEEKPERLHVLALSGFEMAPAIFYLARKFPDTKFTTDSSTWSLMGKYRRMWLDGGAKIDLGTKFGYTDLEHIPCWCPVCNGLNVSQLISKSGFGSSVISAHNLWYTIEFMRMIDAMSTSLDTLLDYTKQRSKKGYDWLQAANYLVENGTEMYRDKYVKSKESVFE